MKDFLCALALLAAAAMFAGAPLLRGTVLLPSDTLMFEKPWSAAAPADATYHNTLISDAVVQSYPWRVQCMRLLRIGVVPLWNPYQFSGGPLAANAQSAVFYAPALVVYALAGVAVGMGLNAILHLWLAGLGMLLFMRVRQCMRAGALFAGLSLMFCGWFVAWLSRPEFVETAAWLPWLPLMFTVAHRSGRMSHAALGGVLLGAQILGGHLQVACYSIMALAAYALFCAFEGPGLKRSTARAALVLACMCIVGLTIGAVQLLPSWELFSLSPRLAESKISVPTAGGAWGRLSWYVNVFMPDFFGNPAHRNVSPAAYNYAEACAYCGVAALFLAAVALFMRRRAFDIFLAAAAVVSLLLAAGTPLLELLNAAMPPLQALTASRFSLLFCFAVCALAGRGLDAVARDERCGGSAGKYAWVIFPSVLLCAVALVVVNARMRPDMFTGGFWRFEGANVARFALLAAMSAGALAAGRRIGPRWACALLFLLLFADVFHWGAGFNSYSPRGTVYPRTALVDKLLKDKADPFRFHAFTRGHTMLMDSATAVGLEDTRGYDSIFYGRYREVVRAFQERRKPGSFVEGPWLSFTAFSPELLKMLNVRYIMTEFDASDRNLPLEPLGEFDGVWLYRYRDELPRAYFVEKWRVVKEPRKAIEAVSSPRFDAAREAVLEDKPVYIDSGEPTKGKAFWAHTKTNAAGELAIQANAPRRALLFVSETAYPGWVAEVDGHTAGWIAANHAFRALPLNAGYHLIQFRFKPISALAGIAVSLFGIFGVCLLLAFPMRKFVRKNNEGT